MNYCHICGGQSPDTALTSGPDPLMQEVGFWAYERLLLVGATNAPSSLARPVVFDPTAGPREQRALPAVSGGRTLWKVPAPKRIESDSSATVVQYCS